MEIQLHFFLSLSYNYHFFSPFPLCCYFLYCCSSAIVDRCKCNLFMNHSTYLCEYTIWICLQYDFSWVNTAKDDLQTLLWIKGMIQSSLQSMGWLLLASRSLAQAPSQGFPFKGILACWLLFLFIQAELSANTGTKLLLGVMHISAQIHEFSLRLHMVIWKCYQHKNLWVIIFNNDFNELWRVQESQTHTFYLDFQRFFCPKQLSSKIGTQ